MKKLLTVAGLLIGLLAYSQIDFGVKAGLNFASVGDMKIYMEDVYLTKEDSDAKTGFHLGAWSRIAIPVIGLYVQPELNYTHLKTEYGDNADYTLNKLDIPVLAGKKILGVGRIFVGPSFQYLLDDDLDVDDFRSVDSDDFTIGIQFGAGAQLGKLGVDLRYDTGLNDTESTFIQNIAGIENQIKVDSRPSQVILGVSYKLTK